MYSSLTQTGYNIGTTEIYCSQTLKGTGQGNNNFILAKSQRTFNYFERTF